MKPDRENIVSHVNKLPSVWQLQRALCIALLGSPPNRKRSQTFKDIIALTVGDANKRLLLSVLRCWKNLRRRDFGDVNHSGAKCKKALIAVWNFLFFVDLFRNRKRIYELAIINVFSVDSDVLIIIGDFFVTKTTGWKRRQLHQLGKPILKGYAKLEHLS